MARLLTQHDLQPLLESAPALEEAFAAVAASFIEQQRGEAPQYPWVT